MALLLRLLVFQQSAFVDAHCGDQSLSASQSVQAAPQCLKLQATSRLPAGFHGWQELALPNQSQNALHDCM